jgi:hypothetical protein
VKQRLLAEGDTVNKLNLETAVTDLPSGGIDSPKLRKAL